MPLFGRKPSRKLTFTDAIEVWKLRWKGETQMRIAAFFDCNIGRINEILKGYKHPGSEQSARGALH
jgi:hypothetical protein